MNDFNLSQGPLGGHRVPLALLCALILLTFSNTLRDTGFPLDNGVILVDSRLHAFTFENLRLIFTQDYWWAEGYVTGLFRPVTTLSYLFNFAVLGNTDHAFGYHLVNLLLHCVNVIFVYWLLYHLVQQGWVAFFAAALFGVHPINVEAVTNIVGRADLLATLCVLGGLHCHILSLRGSGVKLWGWKAALVCVSVIGVFCKETGVMVLPLIVLYDLAFRWQVGQSIRWGAGLRQLGTFLWRDYIFVLPSLLGFGLSRSLIFAQIDIPPVSFLDNPLVFADFLSARLTAMKIIGHYLFLLVWPRHLSCDYSYNQIPLVAWPFSSWQDWMVVPVLLAVALSLACGMRHFRRNPLFFFFVFFVFVAYLPTSNLLPRPGAAIFDKNSWLIGSNMAERFMYLPSIGFLSLAAILVCRCSYLSGSDRREEMVKMGRGLSGAAVLLSLVVALFAVRSFVRNFDWENQLTLTSRDVLSAPASFKLHMMLASALYKNDPQGRHIDKAISQAEKAIVLVGDKYEPMMSVLGTYYLRKGDLVAGVQHSGEKQLPAEARQWYEKGVQTLRHAALLENQLVLDVSKSKGEKLRQEMDYLVIAGSVETYYPLGVALRRLGLLDEAVDSFLTMRRLAPFDHRSYLQLAGLYEDLGEFSKAAGELHQVILLNDQDPQTFGSLARLYTKMEGGECFVKTNLRGADLKRDCPLVYRQICQANLDLVELFHGNKNFEVAWQILQGSMQVFNCPQESYEHLFPKEASQ